MWTGDWNSWNLYSLKDRRPFSSVWKSWLVFVNMNKKERDKYEACLKVYRDNYNTWIYMKEQALKEGLEEGLAKGIAKGIEQGIEIGVNKGKKENSYDIARKMKQNGLSVDMIAECTGLSKSEIEKLM